MKKSTSEIAVKKSTSEIAVKQSTTPEAAVKIKLTSETGYELPGGGHQDGQPGETVETTVASAARLLHIGKATKPE